MGCFKHFIRFFLPLLLFLCVFGRWFSVLPWVSVVFYNVIESCFGCLCIFAFHLHPTVRHVTSSHVDTRWLCDRFIVCYPFKKGGEIVIHVKVNAMLSARIWTQHSDPAFCAETTRILLRQLQLINILERRTADFDV